MSGLTPYEPILGLLALREQHGYELLHAFHEADELGLIWKLSTSQLYALLKRMERDGFVIGRQIETSDGPPRTEYSLTAQGQKHLEAWLDAPEPSASIRRIRTEFLSRLYIAQALGRPTTTLWRRQIATCETELTSMQIDLKKSRSDMERLAQEFVIGQLRAAIDWLHHCRETLVDSHPQQQTKVDIAL